MTILKEIFEGLELSKEKETEEEFDAINDDNDLILMIDEQEDDADHAEDMT